MIRSIFVGGNAYGNTNEYLNKLLSELPKGTKVVGGPSLTTVVVPISDPGSGPKFELRHSSQVIVDIPDDPEPDAAG